MRRPGRVTIAALMSVSLLKAAMGVAHAGDIPAQPTVKKPAPKQQATKAARFGKLPWSILFSISADQAQVTPLGGKSYRLTLENVDERTTWFTDRPVRHAGATPTARLIAGWNIGRDNFAQDPPTAALVMHEPAGGADTLVVELSRPVYDQAQDQLTFTAKEIAAEAEISTAHREDADPLPKTPTTYSEVSLFIDDESTILVAPAPLTGRADSPSPSATPSAAPSASPTPSTSASPTSTASPTAAPSSSASASTNTSTSSSSSASLVDIPITMSDWSVDQWATHVKVLAGNDASNLNYIAKSKLGMNSILQNTDNYIFSFPASVLISNFSDHHLEHCQTGVQLVGHFNLSDVNNYGA